MCSDPACPARVSFEGCVLPSGPSPCGWLSQPPTTMPDKTPREHTAVVSLPRCSLHDDSTRAHAVSGLITLPCPNTDGFAILLHPGAYGASRVLEHLSSCMQRPEDSGGHPRSRDGPSASYCLPVRENLSCLRIDASVTGYAARLGTGLASHDDPGGTFTR